MLLSELIKDLDIVSKTNFIDFEVEKITYDSRDVTPGSAFICIEGASFDGHDFIGNAVEVSAGAVLYSNEEKFSKFRDKLTGIRVADTKRALPVIAMEFYHHPEKLIKIIGVTGTNGKTTTSILINEILKQAGKKTALIGTLYIEVDNNIIETKNTTPSSLDIIKIMSQMVKKGASFLIMEVSSHGLDQDRVYGIPYDIAVFTNFTQDHLDYHGSMDNYFQAKLKFFKSLRKDKNLHKDPCAVLNADDEKTPLITESSEAEIFTYGLNNPADITALDIDIKEEGISYLLKNGKDAPVCVNLKLLGYFNVYNSLAAIMSALKLGIDKNTVIKAVENIMPVRGRFENINTDKGFKIIIDYAHTPDGLENLLKSVKKISKGRIITVFGCGGDRDKGKRPVMGGIAAGYSDIVIITSDNPRSEDPVSIIKQIEEGVVSKTSNYFVEEDREKAIKKALESAGKGDFVVIAGKGHETYQIFKDKTVHFDDRETALKILSKD
ncbi:MAG: UDP-N-acetylmuramoyl-L-alanyl-D-glutamate--2,6-diaminopimelate ligase [Armatimonadota bacterium]